MQKWIIAALATAALAWPDMALAQQPITLKFSHVAPDTPKGKGSEKFKELAEKYTNGKVKIEVYHNSTLYKDKEELEAMQLGAVQISRLRTPSLVPSGSGNSRCSISHTFCPTRLRCAKSRTVPWASACSNSSTRKAWPCLLG
jgi:hypothetical protein